MTDSSLEPGPAATPGHDFDCDVVVVGAGISGLTAAFRVLAEAPHLDVRVLEAEPWPGGTATTVVVDGYAIDRGPNGVLSNVPYTLDLAEELGIGDRLVAASPDAKRRFIYRRGRLRPVPSSLLYPSMLGPFGALRAAVEPLVRTPPPDSDESVHAFAQRRFGRRVADLLAGAMLSGITAGDATRTSMEAMFPKVVAAEREHGSVIRGMAKSRDPDAPKSTLMSFEGGMSTLIDAIAGRLGERVRCSLPVERVDFEAGRWTVRGSWGSVRGRAVVFAAPAPVAARALGEVAPELARNAAGIPYTGIRVVTLAWDRAAFPAPLDGFGFLVPRGEGLRMLGSVWTSSVFPDRAPAGKVLLRVMIGGVLDPEAVELSDAEIEAIVVPEISGVLGIEAAPELVHHTLWRLAIPQYELGHPDRVAALRDAEARHRGLVLCGNAYEGVSLNESVRAANEAAVKVLAAL